MTPAATEATTAPKAKAPKGPAIMHVLDTTATPTYPTRTHDVEIGGIITPFEFQYGKALPLPEPVARKFLRWEAFKLTDERGVIQPYDRKPKQPDEMQAGEKFELKPDETVARYQELSTPALQHRVMEMPGGEQFAEKPDRAKMIKFILDTKAATKIANTSKEAEMTVEDMLADEDEAA